MLKVFLLIIVGLGGDPETAGTFHRWGNTLAEASERLGVPPERLVYLAGETVEGDTRVSGRSTRDEVTKALTKFAAEAGPEDLVFITLIGHGQWDGRAAKFNMPGPDMGPEDFEPLLKKLRTTQIVLVNTASSSGPFLEALSAPGRTLVSATRSGAEHYTTLFGGFFVDALNSPTADADKNKRISVLEAFQFAKAEVTRAYEREGLLATEHPLLDDDGDRKGSAEPTPTGPDGKVAAVLSLGDASDDGLPADPKLRALHLERRELERRVESLRLLKDSMEPARYTSELEKLVTAVALKTREIRAAEGK
jgi:Peptidase C13 family